MPSISFKRVLEHEMSSLNARFEIKYGGFVWRDDLVIPPSG